MRRWLSRRRSRTLQARRCRDAIARVMTDRSPLGFLVVDERVHRIVFANSTFIRMWRLEEMESELLSGEFTTDSILPLCLPLVSEPFPFLQTLRGVRGVRNRASFEEELSLVDGRTIRVFSAQLRDDGNAYVGRLYAYGDITSSRAAHQGLADAREALDQRLADRSAELSRLRDSARRQARDDALAFDERIETFSRLNRLLLDEIADRTRAETALRESEARYRDLVENSEDLICTHDLTGVFLYVNEAAARKIGYRVEDVVGKNIADLIVPKYRHEVPAFLEQTARQGVACGLLCVQTASGDSRLWEYRNTLRTVPGSPPFVHGIAHDVTERVRAEQALRRSEERIRVALKHFPVTVFNQDSDLRYTWIDNSQLGYRPEVILGKTDEEILPPDVFTVVSPLKRRVLETGVGWRGTVTFPHHETVRFLDLTIEPLRDHAGNITGITCAAMDITERVRTEEALRSSEQLFRTLATHAPVGIFLCDSTGAALYVNPQYCELAGLTAEECLGLGWTRAIHPDIRDRFVSEWYAAVSERRWFASEGRFLTPSGETIWFDVRVVPLLNSSGSIDGYVGTVTDMTDRVRAREALTTSEARFRSLVENSPVAMYRSSVSGDCFEAASDALARLLGYASPRELQGLCLSTDVYVTPDGRRRVIEEFRGSDRFDVEVEWRRKDGSIIPLVLRGRTLADSEGRSDAFEVVVEPRIVASGTVLP